MSSHPPSPPAHARSGGLRSRLVHIYEREIWQASFLKDRSLRGWCYAALRVISITITVFLETKVPSRAAALSFSSLLSLGPLVAIGVLVGGFMLGKNDDPNLVANQIGALLQQAAPQLRSLEAAPGATTQPGNAVNPELISLINGFIQSARNGYGGAFGALSLILIVLLMFKAIEDAFNDIWGIRMGRSLLMRVVFYWTTLTLGAVLFFTAVALVGAGAAISVFAESLLARLPGGTELVTILRWSLPALSVALLAGILALVYRVVPNTHVLWRPAFAGAVVVAALLMVNNLVAILFVRRVVLTQNLYGQLAVPLVLMLGLYIFWLYLLIGGIVSYAVQNVHFRNSQAAWGTLAESMRERLSLVVFLTICRRFNDCLPPISASTLGTHLKVPTQLLNECLNRLVRLQLVTTVRPPTDSNGTDYRYQPARPLNRITLLDFKTLDDNFGENPLSASIDHIDPLLARYDTALHQVGEQEFFRLTIDQLFDRHPLEASHHLALPGEHPAPRA